MSKIKQNAKVEVIKRDLKRKKVKMTIEFTLTSWCYSDKCIAKMQVDLLEQASRAKRDLLLPCDQQIILEDANA